MMEADLVSFLLASSPASTLVEKIVDRLYPEVLPQDPVLPAVTYSVISELEFESHDVGTSNFTGRLVQFACWSRTALEAEEVRQALKDRLRLLTEHSGILRGQNHSDGRSDFEPDTNLYRSDADYRIWHV